MTAQQFLNQYGISIDQAYAYLAARISDPAGLFASLKSFGISTSIVTEIIQSKHPSITVDDVRAFFSLHNLDSGELDTAYFDSLRAQLKLQALGTSNDSITGTSGADYIDTGSGNDFIDGIEGDDILIGGSGNDTLKGGWGADYLEGGLGADRIVAGRESKYIPGYYQGNTWVSSRYEYDLSTNILDGGGGDDDLTGGYGADSLFGGYGRDSIYGYEGNDTIDGGDGDDSISDSDGQNLIYGGTGNDSIYVNPFTDVDAGDGNDRITLYLQGRGAKSGVIKLGEGEDYVEIYFPYSDLSNQQVIIDFSEQSSARDSYDWWWGSTLQGLDRPMIYLKGFDFTKDVVQIDNYNVIGQTWSVFSAAETSWDGTIISSYVQFLTSPSQPFMARQTSPKTPDDYGKGFFVIQGATAPGADTVSVAAFLDAYGANHAYGKNVAHFFLVNVSATDMALYQFKDDSGADNIVTPDEVIPLIQFVGVTTDSLNVNQVVAAFV